MVTTWAAIVIVLLMGLIASRRASLVPRGLQNLFEVIIEYFQRIGEGLAGRRGLTYVPLALSIFLFILVANWMGILPGFGTIGWIESPEEVIHHLEDKEDHPDLSKVKVNVFAGAGTVGVMGFGSVDDTITAAEWEEWSHTEESEGKQAGVLVPFLRSANTDVNTTLAIALVAMFFVHFWAFRELGAFSHLGKYINLRRGEMWFFVGILELVGEVARIISFTFRLFGNIFAGEVLLVAMAFLIPLIGVLPFMGLELLVGLIQAFIFAMLTLVFAAVASAAHDSH